MGAAGAHPEASMGLRSFLAVWPSLVKGQAKRAQGPASPLGQEEEGDQEGMRLLCGHMGLPRGLEAYPTTRLGLALPVGSGTTFNTATSTSPYWPVRGS